MILKGQEVAQSVIDELKKRKTSPGKFVVVQVGNDEVSDLYVGKKRDLAGELKVDFLVLKLSGEISEDELIGKIDELNQDTEVKAILVQIPLPKHIDRTKIAKAVANKKDVDGFGYILVKEDCRFIPPTVLAIDELLNHNKIEKQNRRILIVGGGFLVGRPLFRFYRQKNYDVSILDKDDRDYDEKLEGADIVVVATGGGREFTAQDFKPGSTVIDASTVSQGGKVKGDVRQDNWPENINLAPVPGGVGPATVAMLFRNFFEI